MKEIKFVVIGAGYAGIHAVKSILKEFNKTEGNNMVHITLIDKQVYHFRKVLLFKAVVGADNITIPLDHMFPSNVDIVQGEVTLVVSEEKCIRYRNTEGKESLMNYDYLVVAIGSTVRTPKAEQGGIALANLDAANKIHEQWRENFRIATTESNVDEQQRLLTIAVAGAGISGIETSAELAHAMKEEASKLGLNRNMIRIYLLNSQKRLFLDGPSKVGKKLERSLNDNGINVIHEVRAVKEKDGLVSLSNGDALAVSLCIWTLGLQPNPMLRSLGLPLSPEGQIIVDQWYRVQGVSDIYSIGDCARIIDLSSGRADQKTCKEATAQADRLGKIMLAHKEDRHAPSHKGYIDFFCFSLGPEKGIVWTRYWGLDILIEGKLGWKVRKLTWDLASKVKKG